ncbi:MAG: DUF389 domain-containing protein [Psychrobacter sp.]|uniref:DUF389 domain-containing protein n=2 Tax=Psychrobacter TaxID=497 RepID=UPI00178865F4|nr:MULTISPECIES: DUF389 domain-containing protein [unclassified Psychrobacter]MBE0442054.1 DUF389 domain-containing protein [Psychrobacter sp. FME13]
MTPSEKDPINDSVISEETLDDTHTPNEQNVSVNAAEPNLNHSENLDEDENEFGEDVSGAQPPESKVVIESLSEDVAVASLEPSDNTTPESETSDLETQTSTDSTDLKSPHETDNTSNTSETTKTSGTTENLESTKSNEQTSHDEADAKITAKTENIHHLEEGQGTTDTQPNDSVAATTPFSDRNVNTNTSENKIEESQKKETVEDDLDQENESSEQEEEVKEEKEAKLESYKQFVAEQFSNQKVDYPEVRVRIEANALPSRMYFIMNILSAIIASYGLVTNSAAVVIGAMLVAMMLGPITGVALAIIDHRMPLLRRSLITMLIGVSLVVFVGFIVGWLHKDQPLTTEILSRTQPTSMDLMIALAGGTAGAYAMVSPHLSVAVVGVAVATALVPPLAASGILFANGEVQLGLGAFLLAITNIIAIQFTNALVLWVLGFRRLVDDDYKSNTYLTFLRRNAVTLILLGVLGTYLSINLQSNAKQQKFESGVKESINSYFIDKGNVLTNTQFDTVDEHQVVRAVIRGETTPSSYDVRQIESIIAQDMANSFPNYLPIKLQLRYFPVQVIESNPLVKDKLDETDAAILAN